MTKSLSNDRTYNELQVAIVKCLAETYDKVPEKLSRISAPRIMMPNMFQTKDELSKDIIDLLKSVVDTMCDGNLATYDISDVIHSDYYDTLILSQVDRITTALVFAMSEHTLGMLCYYMDKMFIWNWLKSSIVRPNLIQILNEIRDRKASKDIMDSQLQISQQLADLCKQAVEYLMLELNGESFIQTLSKIVDIKFPNKSEFIKGIINDMQIVVPDFISDILSSGTASDINISKCEMFLKEYTVSHQESTLITLFSRYCSRPREFMQNAIPNTITARNASQGTNGIICIDGLTFNENKLCDKIINQMDEEKDEALINANEILKNIKAIIKAHKVYDSRVTLTNTDIIITTSRGTSRTYNFRKKNVSKDITDPFNIFDKPAYMRIRWNNAPDKCALMQTGITQEMSSQLFASGQLRKFSSMSVPARVQDRRDRIKKLEMKCLQDVSVRMEYERLTTERIRAIKYINPLQSRYYEIADEKTLFLTLVETEQLYNQITSDIQALQPTTKKEGGNA